MSATVVWRRRSRGGAAAPASRHGAALDALSRRMAACGAWRAARREHDDGFGAVRVERYSLVTLDGEHCLVEQSGVIDSAHFLAVIYSSSLRCDFLTTR